MCESEKSWRTSSLESLGSELLPLPKIIVQSQREIPPFPGRYETVEDLIRYYDRFVVSPSAPIFPRDVKLDISPPPARDVQGHVGVSICGGSKKPAISCGAHKDRAGCVGSGKRRKSTWIALLLVVLFLAGIVTAAAFLMPRADQKSERDPISGSIQGSNATTWPPPVFGTAGLGGGSSLVSEPTGVLDQSTAGEVQSQDEEDSIDEAELFNAQPLMAPAPPRYPPPPSPLSPPPSAALQSPAPTAPPCPVAQDSRVLRLDSLPVGPHQEILTSIQGPQLRDPPTVLQANGCYKIVATLNDHGDGSKTLQDFISPFDSYITLSFTPQTAENGRNLRYHFSRRLLIEGRHLAEWDDVQETSVFFKPGMEALEAVFTPPRNSVVAITTSFTGVDNRPWKRSFIFEVKDFMDEDRETAFPSSILSSTSTGGPTSGRENLDGVESSENFPDVGGRTEAVENESDASELEREAQLDGRDLSEAPLPDIAPKDTQGFDIERDRGERSSSLTMITKYPVPQRDGIAQPPSQQERGSILEDEPYGREGLIPTAQGKSRSKFQRPLWLPESVDDLEMDGDDSPSIPPSKLSSFPAGTTESTEELDEPAEFDQMSDAPQQMEEWREVSQPGTHTPRLEISEDELVRGVTSEESHETIISSGVDGYIEDKQNSDYSGYISFLDDIPPAISFEKDSNGTESGISNIAPMDGILQESTERDLETPPEMNNEPEVVHEVRWSGERATAYGLNRAQGLDALQGVGESPGHVGMAGYNEEEEGLRDSIEDTESELELDWDNESVEVRSFSEEPPSPAAWPIEGEIEIGEHEKSAQSPAPFLAEAEQGLTIDSAEKELNEQDSPASAFPEESMKSEKEVDFQYGKSDTDAGAPTLSPSSLENFTSEHLLNDDTMENEVNQGSPPTSAFEDLIEKEQEADSGFGRIGRIAEAPFPSPSFMEEFAGEQDLDIDNVEKKVNQGSPLTSPFSGDPIESGNEVGSEHQGSEAQYLAPPPSVLEEMIEQELYIERLQNSTNPETLIPPPVPEDSTEFETEVGRTYDRGESSAHAPAPLWSYLGKRWIEQELDNENTVGDIDAASPPSAFSGGTEVGIEGGEMNAQSLAHSPSGVEEIEREGELETEVVSSDVGPLSLAPSAFHPKHNGEKSGVESDNAVSPVQSPQPGETEKGINGEVQGSEFPALSPIEKGKEEAERELEMDVVENEITTKLLYPPALPFPGVLAGAPSGSMDEGDKQIAATPTVKPGEPASAVQVIPVEDFKSKSSAAELLNEGVQGKKSSSRGFAWWLWAILGWIAGVGLLGCYVLTRRMGRGHGYRNVSRINPEPEETRDSGASRVGSLPDVDSEPPAIAVSRNACQARYQHELGGSQRGFKARGSEGDPSVLASVYFPFKTALETLQVACRKETQKVTWVEGKRIREVYYLSPVIEPSWLCF
ncbi:hypothetical protein BSKO_06180 [Bryopsis sp. KO-2023]|nr:hypothetical protein BSKO_06180 [Bryopsis sp. KO-2023]